MRQAGIEERSLRKTCSGGGKILDLFDVSEIFFSESIGLEIDVARL